MTEEVNFPQYELPPSEPVKTSETLILNEARNPRFLGDGRIDCEVNHPVFGWIPFTAVINDPEEHGRVLYQKLMSGDFGPITAAPERPLADVKKEAIARNNESYNAMTASITADYPQLEKDTWPTQDKEIKAYQADPENALTPWIDTAASIRGLTRIDYINRTIAKVALFEQTSAYLTGLRQKYEDQIKAATTAAEVEALTFVYTLPGG